MLQPLPFKYLGTYNSSVIEDNGGLAEFFGYLKVEIECPKDIRPVLPYKDPATGNIINPTGSWVGTYFSEELKAMSEIGYNIRIINGMSFSKAYLFKDYINHFFHIKQQAELEGNSTLRYIAKLHLNSLYGIFGRKTESLKTIVIDNKDIPL